MENLETMKPSQDERIMAALSHISALMPFMGVIAPIVIWVTQKEKSRYVAFQSLQAMVFQILNIIVMMLSYVCYGASFFLTIIGGGILKSTNATTPQNFPLLFLIPFGIMLLVGISQIAFILYGLFAAIMVLNGKPFHYVIVGERIKRYMQKKEEMPTSPAI